MRFFDLMGCKGHRRRRQDNSFPALLGAEEPALPAVVEPVVIRAKSCRSPQWRPALAAISEDGTAAADAEVGRGMSPALTKKGSVKMSSRIIPQAAAERNTWHHSNQTAVPAFAPGSFFMF